MMLPKCKNEKKNCFAIKNNLYCTCLRNTSFRNNDCPFYKEDINARPKKIIKDNEDDTKYKMLIGLKKNLITA